jgi:hypothetical protein
LRRSDHIGGTSARPQEPDLFATCAQSPSFEAAPGLKEVADLLRTADGRKVMKRVCCYQLPGRGAMNLCQLDIQELACAFAEMACHRGPEDPPALPRLRMSRTLQKCRSARALKIRAV